MNQKSKILPVRYKKIVQRLRTSVLITRATGKPASLPPKAAPAFAALWDTGATGSMISQNVVNEIGLETVGQTLVKAGFGKGLRDSFLVDIWFINDICVPKIKVSLFTEEFEFDVIIGMDIISLGDFAITNTNGITRYRFRIPSIGGIDFSDLT